MTPDTLGDSPTRYSLRMLFEVGLAGSIEKEIHKAIVGAVEKELSSSVLGDDLRVEVARMVEEALKQRLLISKEKT